MISYSCKNWLQVIFTRCQFGKKLSKSLNYSSIQSLTWISSLFLVCNFFMKGQNIEIIRIIEQVDASNNGLVYRQKISCSVHQKGLPNNFNVPPGYEISPYNDHLSPINFKITEGGLCRYFRTTSVIDQ